MLAVMKMILSLLSIMHGMLDLVYYLFYLASKDMSMRVDGGFCR